MLPIADEALRDWLSGALTRVDGTIRGSLLAPDDPFLTEVATHLTAAGGKRLRPALALLAAQFGDRDAGNVVAAAAAVELIHVASLYHDDVMDSADVRRGVPSVNARWGNRMAVLAGDYLLARGAELCVPLGSEALREQARLLTRLVRGQLRETVGARAGSDAERYYLGVIADKTAALFALALRLGARAAGAPAGAVEALGRYGEALGLAFQLTDDLLDLTVPVQVSGKPAGADLRGGVATLPMLRAARGPGRSAVRLRRLLSAGPLGAPGRRAAARLIRRSPALAETGVEVDRYVDRARAELVALPAGPARDALADLAAALGARGRTLVAG
ncbi:polyprenyl synthetase family protein [Plantactinospora siamensis]|uniref:Polyprenyl synthetase family protein n=1 Tax=Plantactinospora siamensis TaxID=555372 RepID=A0ABV6P5M1_9ACTN